MPPLKDVPVAIADLPPGLDGYTILHLTDLHISRLFPAAWAGAVVARANALRADLIVVTGDFIDGSLEARRSDVRRCRTCARATESGPCPATTSTSSTTTPGCATSPGWGSASSPTPTRS